MKVRIWQAFASNNSGSYTIVGSFDTPEQASEVAAALREMAERHTAWLKQGEGRTLDAQSSPLAAFARAHGLTWQEGRGLWDDWPEYGEKEVPEVVAHGHQVLVHVDYTVSMPPTLGEFFYKRGGRVTTELDHAHRPIVATFTAWWPWKERVQKKVEAAVAAVISELTGEDGVLFCLASEWHAPAWSTDSERFEGDLRLACIFRDLCAGYLAVGEAVSRHGGQIILQVAELQHGPDPFADLRPSSPASKIPRYDVWIAERVRKTLQLRDGLAAIFDDASVRDLDRAIDAAPGTLLRCLFEPTAKSVAALLEAHGVAFELRAAS